MLHHSSYLILSDPARCPAGTCQRALRLFAELDFTTPRSVIPGELDRRFTWPAGESARVLNRLEDMGILKSLARERAQPRVSRSGFASAANSAAGGSLATLWVLAPEMTWTPRALAEAWERDQRDRERMSVVEHRAEDGEQE